MHGDYYEQKINYTWPNRNTMVKGLLEKTKTKTKSLQLLQ